MARLCSSRAISLLPCIRAHTCNVAASCWTMIHHDMPLYNIFQRMPRLYGWCPCCLAISPLPCAQALLPSRCFHLCSPSRPTARCTTLCIAPSAAHAMTSWSASSALLPSGSYPAPLHSCHVAGSTWTCMSCTAWCAAPCNPSACTCHDHLCPFCGSLNISLLFRTGRSFHVTAFMRDRHVHVLSHHASKALTD